MKKTLLLITLFLLFFSCNKSENEIIDTQLFYGKWYTKERCKNQNYKEYKDTGEYIHRFSLNVDCNTNTYDIKEISNIYSLNGDEIIYGNESNTKIIISGSNDNSSTDQIAFEFYRERIIELNEEVLTIEIETKISGRTEKKITKLYRNLD